MPIESLPESTKSSLLSTLALYTTPSLVKELLDNAYDANATSITVEISSNALDIIQVKDDGKGIRPEDAAKMGQRHCTSKLRKIEELQTLGDQSLGFRGEALASAVEMSRAVEVGSRVEGETVGRLWRIGNPEGQKSVSRPLGTTIKVIDFLKSVPVRKQAALKNTIKTLSNIKRLLQSYALARPAVRLSLKILKAKDTKADWTFAPGQRGSLDDAVLKIIDKDTRGECVLESYVESGEEDTSDLEKDGFKLEAVLPRKDPDLPKINNRDIFVSIDARPVSCKNGVLKQVITLFKSYIRSASSRNPSEKVTFKDPFMAMNVTCPTGAYDPNIEPSKDDVLFDDPPRFLLFIGRFFESVYGPLAKESSEQSVQTNPSRTQISEFNVLLARRPEHTILEDPRDPASNSSGSHRLHSHMSLLPSLPSREFMANRDQLSSERADSPLLEEPSLYPVTPQSGRQKWRRSTHGLEADLEETRNHDTGLLEEEDLHEGTPDREEIVRDLTLNNPWIMAKMNASLKARQSHPSINQHPQLRVSTGGDIIQRTLMLSPERSSSPVLDFSQDHPMPGPPLRPFNKKRPRELDGSLNQSSPQSTGLDDWINPPAGSSVSYSSRPNRSTAQSREDAAPSSPISNTESTSSFVTASDLLRQADGLSASNTEERWFTQPVISQFAEHLDYENRKRAATLAARLERSHAKKNSSLGFPSTKNSPHSNRRNAAAAALSSNPAIDSGERALWRSAEGRLGPSPGKKKGTLPMEKIEPSLATHTIMQVLSPTAQTIKDTLSTLSEIDKYLVTGDLQDAFLEILDTNRLGTRVSQMLSQWENDGTVVDIDSRQVSSEMEKHIQLFA